MFYPDAVWRPGPASKRGYPGLGANQARGVVCHSMVGYFAGAMIELDKLDRRASWHFSILQNGKVYQHYDTADVTWHCGSKEWNAKLIGIEHEGGYNPHDEPLTVPQRDASVALVRWLAVEHAFPLERQVALWEHREVAPTTDATSCPSHRIPWDYYTEEKEIVLLACGDSPSGYRLYQLAVPPVWIVDPIQAQVLKDLSGEPKPATWGQLQALGAS